MNDPIGTLHLLAQNLARALQPLRDAVADPNEFTRLLARLGWRATALPPDYQALSGALDVLDARLSALDASPATLADLLAAIAGVRTAIGSLKSAPVLGDGAQFLRELPGALFNLLLLRYLGAELPLAFSALRVLGIVRSDRQLDDGVRREATLLRLDGERAAKLFTDPLSLPASLYGWGTSAFEFPLLADHLYQLLEACDATAAVESVPLQLSDSFQQGADQPAGSIRTRLRWTLAGLDLADDIAAPSLLLLELPAEGTRPPGVILQPDLPPQLGDRLDAQLAPGVLLHLRGASNLGTPLGVVIRPGELLLRTPLSPGSLAPSGTVSAELELTPDAAIVLVGEPGGTRLEVTGWKVGVQLDWRGGKVNLQFGGDLAAALVVSAGDQGGFLGDLLGGEDLTAQLPVSLRWSSASGFSLTGAQGWQATVAPALEIGPISVDALHVQVGPKQDGTAGLSLAVTSSLSGALGPVSFGAEGLGLQLGLKFGSGNAGWFGIGVGARLPDKLELAVDGGPVTGAGALVFQPDQGLYGGSVSLRVLGITVSAYGVLQSLPGGGTSFFLLVSASFPPLQLGWGFTLLEVGGAAGVQREARVDLLRQNLLADPPDPIFFPQDPARDALKVLDAIERFFPPAPGRFVFGPMATIGWGTPTLVTLRLALLVELPEPVRLLLFAQLTALLPSKELPLVRLKMDALGVLDFGKRQASLDARLYDSNVGGITVSGDMAARLRWGDGSSFLIAAGGFNPRFQPPPDFPKLRRVSLSLASGDNPRIRLDGYLALTSNTAQVGAFLDLYAEALGFSLEGYLGFDALFQFSPFSFIADIQGGIVIRHGGDELMTLTLALTLSGPSPWHARGSVSFGILFISITIGFDVSIGGSAQGEGLPPSVNARELLRAAIIDPRSWSGGQPRDCGVLLLDSGSADGIWLHPLADVALHQRAVPLGMTLERFYGSDPGEVRRFDLQGVLLQDSDRHFVELRDDFPSAQFLALNDEEKLSRPSFESMLAGFQIDLSAPTMAPAAPPVAIGYQSFLVQPPRAEDPPGTPGTFVPLPDGYSPDSASLPVQTEHGAAGRAADRAATEGRLGSSVRHVMVRGVRHSFVDARTLSALPGRELPETYGYTESSQLLDFAVQVGVVDPGARIVPRHEVPR